MFSPTAGPTSSRTSPSERKWLPRTSSLPTRRRSLAKTFCHAVHAPTTTRMPTAAGLQPDERAGGDAAAARAHARPAFRAEERRLLDGRLEGEVHEVERRRADGKAASRHARGLHTFTSSSSSIPVDARTRSRARSRRASTSEALAPPSFTTKFA